MEKHSLDGVKDLWVFVRYTGKPPPVVCKECKKSPCVCARLPIGRPKTVMLPGGVKLEMVYIRPGTFMMGSPTSEKGRGNDERQHRVTISKPFYLGKYEVTQEQYVALMGNNPSRWKGKQLPVEQVTWHDAVAFCKRLTEQERKAGRLPAGYAYQLPTEAQWEYACRAGTTTPFAVSFTTSNTNYDTVMRRVGWFNGNSGGQTHPVGKKTANPWGLYDMHGNVLEWCADRYGTYLAGSVPDPTGASAGSHRIYRGGGWHSAPRVCRSAQRDSFLEPSSRWHGLGFRVALAPVR
jgi:formylglycine-generating enzyme required for sulfatase activity